MDQFRYDRNYLEAAKLAFTGNYRQVFMTVVEEMLGAMDPEKHVEMDEEGNITEEPMELDPSEIKESTRELVSFAIEQDAYRFMDLLMTMNSTIRHFKSANTLFLQLLQLKKLRGTIDLGRRFESPQIE